jgi:MFS family permease
MTQLDLESSIPLLLLGFFLFGLGMGSVISPATAVMQNVLPLSRAGAGSAVQNTVRQLAGALGVAVVGSVLGSRYADNVAPAFADLPSDFPAEEAEQSVVATDAVLNGLEAQQALPVAQLEQVRQAAYEAFVSASHATMLLSAMSVTVAVVLVFTLLPAIKPPQQGDQSPTDTWDDADEDTSDEVLAEEGLATKADSTPSATDPKSPPASGS